ncbi:MAG: hypothetical protein ACREV3_13355 [Gammaproteobacteria bacterium]
MNSSPTDTVAKSSPNTAERSSCHRLPAPTETVEQFLSRAMGIDIRLYWHVTIEISDTRFNPRLLH